MSDLSAYERAREAQIARNKEEIERLGLAASRRRAREQAAKAAKAAKADPPASSTVSRNTRKRKAHPRKTKSVAARSLRRSKRNRGAKTIDYTRERVDTSAEPSSKREIREQYKKAKKKQTADVLAESAAWLERHRSYLREKFISPNSPKKRRKSAKVLDEHNSWRAVALDKWGDGVLMAERKGDRGVDWEVYVLSRSSTPPPRAPLGSGLLQEEYAHCPWKLLISCVLMSRVSSANVKVRAIEGFFAKYPTPTAVLSSRPNEMLQIIKPLGLFPGRHRSVVEISTRFLTMVDQPFTVGLQPELKIYGVGAFGVDSFNIFCKSQTLPLPTDKNLASYCRWVNSLE